MRAMMDHDGRNIRQSAAIQIVALPATTAAIYFCFLPLRPTRFPHATHVTGLSRRDASRNVCPRRSSIGAPLAVHSVVGPRAFFGDIGVTLPPLRRSKRDDVMQATDQGRRDRRRRGGLTSHSAGHHRAAGASRTSMRTTCNKPPPQAQRAFCAGCIRGDACRDHIFAPDNPPHNRRVSLRRSERSCRHAIRCRGATALFLFAARRDDLLALGWSRTEPSPHLRDVPCACVRRQHHAVRKAILVNQVVELRLIAHDPGGA